MPEIQAEVSRSGRAGATAALAGLALGAVAGWIGLIGSDDSEGIARAAGTVAWALVVVLPAAAVAVRRRSAPTASPVVTAAVAGALGVFLFLMTAVQVPAVFGSHDAADIARELGPRWPAPAGVALAVTVVAGFIDRRR